MDLAVFSRRRAVLCCWIWVPVLVVGGAEWAAQACARRAAVSLAHSRYLSLSLIPEAKGRLKTADTLLGCFQLKNSGESQTAEALSARINECAHRHGFSIDLLRFQSASNTGGGKGSGITVDLEGSGGIVPMLTWLDEIQRPENLLNLDAASVHLLRMAPAPVYGVKMQFRFSEF